MAGPLSFRGKHVLVEADNLYCICLLPSGYIFTLSSCIDTADDIGKHIEAMLENWGGFGINEAVWVTTLDQWQAKFGEQEKPQRRTSKRPRLLKAVAS